MKMRLSRLVYRPGGVEGNALGKTTERRFLHNCEKIRLRGLFPIWLISFRAATPEEDARGIDIWAITDIGEIAIQVKRSNIERTRFLQRQERKHIICIAAHHHQRFQSVFDFTISQIAQQRRRMQSSQVAL